MQIKPERIHLSSPEIFIYQETLEDFKNRRKSTKKTTSKQKPIKSSILVLELENLNLILQTHTRLGSVVIKDSFIRLSASDQQISLNANGRLQLDDNNYTVTLKGEHHRDGTNTRLSLNFDQPVPLSLSTNFWASLTGVELYKSKELTIELTDLQFLHKGWPWLQKISAEKLLVILATTTNLAGSSSDNTSWKLKEILVTGPRLKLDAGQVVQKFLAPTPSQDSETVKAQPKNLKNPKEQFAKLLMDTLPSPQTLGPVQLDINKGLPEIKLEEGTVELKLTQNRIIVVEDLQARLTENSEGKILFIEGKEDHAEYSTKISLSPQFMPEQIEIRAEQVHITRLFELLKYPLPDPLKLTGKISLELQAEPVPDNEFRVYGTAALSNGLLYHPAIADDPLSNLDASVDYDLLYNTHVDTLTITTAYVSLAQTTLHIKGTLEEFTEGPYIQARMWLDKTPCSHMVEVIPPALIPRLSQMKISGSMSPWMKWKLDVRKPRSFRMRFKGIPGTCKVESLGAIKVKPLLSSTYKKQITEGTDRRDIWVGPGKEDFTPLNKLPSYVGPVMYITEDIEFYEHGGIQPGLISRAIRMNMERGYYVYGGSSLTQQLVKNLFLERKKTVSRKIEEGFITWRVEELLSKDQILELYVNCIEFGPDIYGISQASKFYFGKDATRLTPLQASYLASLKPYPRHGGYHQRRGFPKRGSWPAKMKKILVRLHNHKQLSSWQITSQVPYRPKFYRP